MEELGDATEKAGKQAKKYLAAFDDLNIISSGAGGEAGKTPEIAMGDIGGANIPTAKTTMDIKTEETGGQSIWLSQRLEELKQAFSGLQNIDLSKLSESLKKLAQPLEKIGGIVWDTILWGIENVIVPLADFTVSDVLPRFFETLANALDVFAVALEQRMEIVEQFFNEFLKPILEYAAKKISPLLDKIDNQLKEAKKMLQETEAWEDLKTILSAIYDVLEPVVKFIIDLVTWVTDFALTQAWIDTKTLFKDIEDVLGLIAALIEGDFDDAWQHLSDIIWDNRVEHAKESFDNLKTSINEAKEKITEIAEAWGEKLGAMIDKWKEKISGWWADNVEPWFTKEKWEELFFKIGESLANAVVGVNGLVEKWKTNITNWWNDDVTPWFTTAKWKEVFHNIVTSISNFFTAKDGFVQTWKNKISEWWTNEVTPWFTVEKWKELGKHIQDGLVDGFNGAINGIKGIINKILDGFQGLVNGAIDMINSLIDGYNKVADVTPGISSINRIGRINLSKYKLPMLAQGAVIPPNREFLAVLGDQKHGTNIETPLDTMIQAFKTALVDGGYGGETSINFTIELDGDTLYKGVKKAENKRAGISISNPAFAR
jgi:DNA-binding transcriptional regulator GbsR (MarR family)